MSLRSIAVIKYPWLLTCLLFGGVLTNIFGQLPTPSFNQLRVDESLSASKYNSLFEDKYGFIWFGSITGGGLYRYDGYNIRPFINDPAHLSTSLASSTITYINVFNDSMMYVGTLTGYSTIELTSGKITNYSKSIDEIEDPLESVVYTFIQDSIQHRFWVGTGYGIGIIEAGNGIYHLLHPKTPDGKQAAPIKITKMLADPLHPDILILAGPDGLFRYSIAENQIEALTWPYVQDSVQYICTITIDSENNLWIGTRSDKLYRYQLANEVWSSFTIPKAKSTDYVMAITRILPVAEDKVWIAALSHVGILNPQTGHFDAWEYDQDNPAGLLPNYHYLDIMPDRHGKIWISSWFGIQYSNQILLPPSGKVSNPTVVITDLDIKPILSENVKPLIYTGTITLDGQQRDITFHYALPNPRSGNSVNYEYRLDGYDKDWTNTDQRSIRYAKLKGGKYIFQIKAQDGKNASWTPLTTLSINIPKGLTEQIWFWIIIALSMIALCYAIIRFFITRTRMQSKMKADFELQLSEIQMQALRAQMNPHFLFNSLNSIKYYAISKSKDETAAYLSKFALLVRTILTNSKSRTISLKDELDALKLYIEIEHLRLEGKFDYEFDIDPGIHIHRVQIPPMILQPFVENAIWHGLMHKEGKGLLRVQVQDMGRQIQCLIEDNGIGREKAAALRKAQVEHRKSEGMQITADRIELINRIYHIDTKIDVIDLKGLDGQPVGTRVVINIPLIRDEEE